MTVGESSLIECGGNILVLSKRAPDLPDAAEINCVVAHFHRFLARSTDGNPHDSCSDDQGLRAFNAASIASGPTEGPKMT